MKKSLWKRVLALALCLALSAGYLPVPIFAEEAQEPVAFQQEEPVEEPEEETQETQAPTTEPTTEPTEESTAATEETTEPAEGSTEAPQEEPDLDQAVSTLQALIDALPENVTEDNAELVAAQLETVFDGLETLTEDQLAQLDLTRYRSALAALDALTGGLQEADTLEEEETKVASIIRDGETTEYATLAAAIKAAQDNDTVTLLVDVAETVTSDAGTTLTLNLSGKTLAGLELTGSMNLTLTGGGTVQSVTLSGGGTLELDNATVESLTIDCRTTAPKLIGKPFNEVRILSDHEMTYAEMETAFSPEGYELHVQPSNRRDWTPLTPRGDRVITLSWTEEEDGWACEINARVYFHIHSVEPGKEYDFVCPGCGAEVRAKVGNRYYVYNEKAVAAAADGTTLVVMSEQFSANLFEISGTFNIDLNGYNLGVVNAQDTVAQTITIRNSRFEEGESEGKVSTVSLLNRNSENGDTLTVESGVTIDQIYTGGDDVTVNGGTVETINQINYGRMTVQVNSGKVDCVKIKELDAKLSGGPFNQVVLINITNPASIDPSQLVPEGGKLLFTENYRAVTAADFASGTDGCTLTGPVEGHIVHSFEQDTGLCPCGEQAEAKVNGTVYKTFEEALEALNSKSFLYLLKDVDRSGKTLSITKVEAIYWNGYTLTVRELTIDAGMVRMEDKTGTGGVKGTVRMGECYQLRIYNGTYSGLTVRNGCTIYGGTYGVLTAKTDCDSVTINGGTFSKMDLFGNNQIIIPPGKMFYTTTGRVWTEVLGGQVIQELTLKDHDPHAPDETTGKCICGLNFAASVTAGETTAYYDTLQAAITAAAETSGSTVKLFTGGANVSVSSGTFTLDWNSYKVSTLTVTGGTLTLTGKGGVSGTGEKALDIQGGTVDIQSGSYNNVYVGESANVTIEGGSFTGKEGQKPIDAADMSKVRFAVGKAVYDRDYEKKWRSNLPFNANGYLTVKDCTEHYADSEPDTCVYCATKLDARLDVGSSSYFGTFEDALAKAQEEEGSTLQLLRDVKMADSGEISASGNFTIDWNGYTVSGGTMKLENGSKITMKNGKESGGFRGQEIRLVGCGTLTIQGGSYAPILHPVGDGDAISPWNLTIQGGTFTGNETNPPLPRDYPITVDTGYVFYDQDNNVVSNWATQGFAAGSTVTLKYHENHDPDETGKCVCGYEGAAMVRVMDWGTDGGFTETCYDTFQNALTAVESASGTNITLTLWQDVALNGAATVTTNSPLTIDWNGKTLTGTMGLYLGANNGDVVTLKDSKGDGALHAVLMLSSKSHIVSGNYYGVDEQNDNVETKISGGTFHERGEDAARSAPITFNSKGTEITLTGDNAYHNADGEVIGQGDVKLQAVVTVGPHTHLATNCPCGRSYAAAVTVNGKETIYSTLTEAFENVVSGCTLKLLSDGTLESDPDTWDFTLDLGGCRLDTGGHDPNPGYLETFTLRDSVGNGQLKADGESDTGGIDLNGTMVLESGTVKGYIAVTQGNSLTISGGAVTGTVSGFGSTLIITGGNIGTLGSNYAGGTTTLHGGTFGKLDGCDRYMLDEGYALYDAEGNVVNIGGTGIQNVTIQKHEHDFSNGSCPCGGVTSGEGKDLLKPDDYETLQMAGYQVNGEEVQLQSRTWGGKEYLSRYDGVSLKNAIIQTYTWNYNANNDAYPTGTTVYRVVENKNHVLELKEETALKDLLEYKGASIRCEGNPGVRIITGMTRANKAALTGAGLDGYKLLEYGTVIAWANEMNGDSSLVLGKSYSRFGYAYNQAQNKDKVFDFTETGILYTNVLVNFAMSRCGDSVILRSFAVLEKDGVRFTIYGGQVGRTISGIAKQVLGDSTVDLTETERAYVQSLVDAGKGDSNG